MSVSMKYCSKCGRPIDASISFCPYCDPTLYQLEMEKRGVRQTPSVPQQPTYQQPQYQQSYYPQQTYYPPQQPKKGRTGIIIIGIVIVLFVSCALVGLFINPRDSEIDDTPPTVVSTTPANGDVNVSSQLVITIVFSEPMRQSTGAHWALSFHKPATISREKASTQWVNDRTVRITGLEGFDSGSTYVISISYHYADWSTDNAVWRDMEDRAGNLLEWYKWSFTIRQ